MRGFLSACTLACGSLVRPRTSRPPVEDRSDRLRLLFAMFELNLKRALTPEERRLLALSDPFCRDEEESDDQGLAKASGS